MTTTPDHTPFDFDLVITKTARQDAGGSGTWISGTVDGEFRFDALVFPQHADEAEYELGESKISKLWIAKVGTRETVYSFDRGLDRPATTPAVQGIVAFLCDGLADLASAY